MITQLHVYTASHWRIISAHITRTVLGVLGFQHEFQRMKNVHTRSAMCRVGISGEALFYRPRVHYDIITVAAITMMSSRAHYDIIIFAAITMMSSRGHDDIIITAAEK